MRHIFFPHIAVIIQYIRDILGFAPEQLFDVMGDNTLASKTFLC